MNKKEKIKLKKEIIEEKKIKEEISQLESLKKARVQLYKEKMQNLK